MKEPLILASASPRRADLLHMIGCRFDIHPSDIEEKIPAGLPPLDVVRRLASQKAAYVEVQYPNRIVIGADTIVVVDNRVLGKPTDRESAAQMLRILSGRTHQVVTAVILRHKASDGEVSETATTDVVFRSLSDAEVSRYLDTDEPYDKAGAYGIQGGAAFFVESIRGCFYNVVGFPISKFWTALDRMTDGNAFDYCETGAKPDLLALGSR
ncbi:Maf family protein [bacterium]|nr:Maf family protein [bacterium]